ncbi:relaxase/mobilization nuclease domain-containing protein [Acinetobacter pecorum]|uniref:Mobilization protein n=1 Tax=Acinetobacter pecorum TaxID=2762215 RepID=A0ABR8W0V2_9GAMM|nr:mobilization protein [Acinetobacter pecorum]MBD8010664.1 mobilization protein [Acinetobacter pecorum]
MKVHIKFLDHGKGSATHASAYLLDRLDHRGNVRAGVQVLRGDATTFNAICHASPHLWKYTSGVIAWSKDDDPTDAQIMEVLNNFEEHAFAGLEQSQYHLFAVLHTDEDGSKHIHVLAPRLDMQSGKSLNIAPPSHEKHFDALRDYFNTKYQWSRPDDLLLMQTTQEPNHVAKINAQAKKYILSEDLKALIPKQFRKTIDNYIKTLLRTQTIQNRADIVQCISQLEGVESVKQRKDSLTVEMIDGKKYRLKGDFYYEQFEIGLYIQRLRAAAESRKTPSVLAAALSDANQFRETYRAKRAAYNQKHYAFAQRTGGDNSLGGTSQLIVERDRGFITPSHTNTDRGLHSTNQSTPVSTCQYRYCGSFKSEIEHRFVFNINSKVTVQNKQSIAEYLDRPTQFTKEYTSPNTASDHQSKPANRERNRNADYGKTGCAKSDIHVGWGDLDWTIESFNRFIYGLSNSYKRQDHQSTTTDNSTEFRINHSSNRIFEEITKVSHANRNRSIFDRTNQLIATTKQLIGSTKRNFEPTGQFIKKYFDQLQRSGAAFSEQNRHIEYRERNSKRFDFSNESRTFKSRTGRIFGAITARISRKLENPITNALNDSIQSTGFKSKCQRLSAERIALPSTGHQQTTDRFGESTLENIAISATNRLLRRLGDAKRADQYAWDNCRRLNDLNQKLGKLEPIIAQIRCKPKPATDWQLRSDGFYPGYLRAYQELSAQQQQAYQDKKVLWVIEITEQKTEKILAYMTEARRNIDSNDYARIEEIIKNDERMLKYLKCELILSHKNNHLEDERASYLYLSCLKNFDEIKERIKAVTSSTYQSSDDAPSRVTQHTYAIEFKSKQENDSNADVDL